MIVVGYLTYTYLDLVPSVPFNTSGDKLLLCGTTIRNCNIIPVNYHFHETFFKCFAPDLNPLGYLLRAITKLLVSPK